MSLLIADVAINTEGDWGTWGTLLSEFLFSQLEVPARIQENNVFTHI